MPWWLQRYLDHTEGCICQALAADRLEVRQVHAADSRRGGRDFARNLAQGNVTGAGNVDSLSMIVRGLGVSATIGCIPDKYIMRDMCHDGCGLAAVRR